jgi:Na+(H+)/acetate symporter ActP
MIRKWSRVTLSVCIWMISAVLVLFAMSEIRWLSPYLAIVLIMGAAMMIIFSLWMSTGRASETIEKAKRGAHDTSRLEMLLALMGEDERAAFKETLKQRLMDEINDDASDGELSTSLAALLQVDERSYRRR